MLEMLINPKKAERKPWEMFFVGAFYASLSILLVKWMFSQDFVLSNSSDILIVTFTVMFSMPFIYYTIKLEERRVSALRGTIELLKEHRKAIYVFMFLFMGFVVAFAFWSIVFDDNPIFKAQIKTYCAINRPAGYNDCIKQYGITDNMVTGGVTSLERLGKIFWNNFFVSIITLIFSIVFGAGVIFILAWNASVIAAAIGIFTDSNLSQLPHGLLRYMIHGIPEIMAYFIVGLAGGLISIAVIKHEVGTERFWEVLRDSLSLILFGILVLFIAALIEVFVTPVIF